MQESRKKAHLHIHWLVSRRALYALGGLASLYLILSRIWVAEDAYITFRSVENLYLGHGLVYNPGSRVEASTHPLWMLGLILVRGIGFPLHQGAIFLGLLCSGLSLALILRRDWDFGYALPFTALLLFTNSGIRDFSTAGMEYSMVFLLLTLFVYSLDRSRLSDRPFAHGALLGLLYLARPELALLAVYYSAFFLWEVLGQVRKELRLSRARLRSLFQQEVLRRPSRGMLLWGMGLLSTAFPYHLFRWLYYHDVFPNTYYAKAGLSTYYIQGLKYLGYTLLWSPGLLLVIAFFLLRIPGLLPERGILRTVRERLLQAPVLGRLASSHTDRSLAAGVFREAGAALFVGWYILRVGADFMAYRFLLPEMFLFTLAVSRLLPVTGSHASGQKGKQGTFGVKRFEQFQLFHQGLERPTGRLLVFGLFLSLTLWPEFTHRGWVASERWVFTNHGRKSVWELLRGADHPWAIPGRKLRRLADCLNLGPIQITNSVTQAYCMPGSGLGYFGLAAGPKVLILDEQALPNRDVARLPVLYRWRPGHEHYVDLNFVLEKRALFCNSGEPVYDRIMQTPFGTLLSWDEEVLATMPELTARLNKLRAYQKALPSPILKRLEGLYHTDLETLISKSRKWAKDPLLQSKKRCWLPRNSKEMH